MVIFVSGFGEDHHTWQSVQDSVSKLTLTISYDRAGSGRSKSLFKYGAYNGMSSALCHYGVLITGIPGEEIEQSFNRII